MVLPESTEKVVASSDPVVPVDYRDITSSGGRIGSCSPDLHAILMQRRKVYEGFFEKFLKTLRGQYSASDFFPWHCFGAGGALSAVSKNQDD
jgi:hypothetical protein